MSIFRYIKYNIYSRLYLSGKRDSNSRPSAWKADALTN